MQTKMCGDVGYAYRLHRGDGSLYSSLALVSCFDSSPAESWKSGCIEYFDALGARQPKTREVAIINVSLPSDDRGDESLHPRLAHEYL